MSKHYDTLETRSPAEREKALMQALPQQVAHAKENAPFFASWLKDVDPAAVTSRDGARQIAGAAQGDAGRGAEEAAADGWADHRADEQGAPCLHVARPDLRDRHRRARLFPRRAGHACRRLPARRRRLQHLLLSPDARRHHDGIGAAGARLRRRAGRRRQHRAAARRHRRDPAHRLCRHAVLPEDPDREGGRAGQGYLVDQERLRRRRGAAAVAAPDVHRQGHDLPAELRHGRSRHHRLRIGVRSKA